jgi:hypothetical protein
MREDTFTNTVADAAAYERIRGRDEAIDQMGFAPHRTIFCSVCQRGTKPHVCGPCLREMVNTVHAEIPNASLDDVCDALHGMLGEEKWRMNETAICDTLGIAR